MTHTPLVPGADELRFLPSEGLYEPGDIPDEKQTGSSAHTKPSVTSPRAEKAVPHDHHLALREPLSSSDPTGHVRRGRTEQTAGLARVLARAFEHDPVSAFILPNPSRRREGIEAMYRLVFVPGALKDNECYTTIDHAGVALWKPAGKPRPGLGESLGLAPTMLRILGHRTPRALRVLHYMESQLPTKPHAHLLFLGTDPDRQGQGVGSLLLRHTLSQLDSARSPAYLEASTPRSRALYLRHGFAVMNEIRLPGGGPPLWRMWREPQSSAIAHDENSSNRWRTSILPRCRPELARLTSSTTQPDDTPRRRHIQPVQPGLRARTSP